MPKPLEITVSYHIGISRNIGNYSNAKVDVQESERWDVSDLDEVAIELLASSVYDRLRVKLDRRVEEQDTEWRNQ